MRLESPLLPGRRRCIRALLASGVGVGVGTFSAAASARAGVAPSPGFYATPLSEQSHHLGFALTDLEGRLCTPKSYAGSVLVLFFGFLSCPSICPSTVLDLVAARQAMGPQARRVRLAFATLDPQRDSAAAVRAWLGQFDRDLIGLRDSPEAITRATAALQLKWQRVPGAHASSYTIDHGVQSYTFDTQGRLRLLVRPGPSAKETAADWQQLLAGA